MIIATENIILGDFTFKFEFGTTSRRFYITPNYYKNTKRLLDNEYDSQFVSEYRWFKNDYENYLLDSNMQYKITNNFHYTSFGYKKEIELSIKDKYDNEYTCIVNRESFVIFIKLLIFYYEHCNSER